MKMVKIICSSLLALKSPFLIQNDPGPTKTAVRGRLESLRCGQTVWDAGKWPLWGQSKEKLELSKLSLLWTATALTSIHKIQIWRFVSRKWKDIFVTLKKWVHKDLGSLWFPVRGQWTDCCWKSQNVWRKTRFIPFSLTTSPFQHYIAQQRVDRADSYSPELEHLMSKTLSFQVSGN